MADFVDEMPNNSLHVGVTVLASRNANFIDVGRDRRDLVSLLLQHDTVLHRFDCESAVEGTPAVVRQMLDSGSPTFDDDCSRFYKNKRAVRPASSERARELNLRDVVDQWRSCKSWLAPLKAPGPVLDDDPLSKNRS